MGVTFELIEGPYPHLCAIYRCECGAADVQHGAEAGAGPPGWRELPADGRWACPACAAAARADDEHD